MTLTIMPISQQKRNWSCGLVALESVRKFFSQSSVQVSGPGEETESRIISRWLRAIQRELGSPYNIRDPPTPGQTYAALEDDESGFEMPNSQWYSEDQATNADHYSLSTTSRLLAHELQVDHCDISGSIKREQQENVRLLRRMQAVLRTLQQRAQSRTYRQRAGYSFLQKLLRDVKSWLEQI